MQHDHGGGEPSDGDGDSPAPNMDLFSLPSPPVPAPADFSSSLTPVQPQPAGMTSEELPAAAGSGGSSAVNFHDDDMTGGSGGAGASGSGNRWPRQETLALIRIRSEMDAAFRNAALKAPVWEEVSRKLAALGYQRSAKKCKEKFENVDKYYRRTKEGRAGRQDGKSYRFFSELEALHAAAPPPQQHQVQDPLPLAMARMAPPPTALAPPGGSLPGLSFSSMSDSESDDESDDEESGGSQEDLADTRSAGVGGAGASSKEMMAMFEGMMRQVTEKQEAMQRLFLETLDKWESERTEREEAWRRKEAARMSREREALSQERAAAATRDAALIAFLQRVGGPSIQLPPSTAINNRSPTPAYTPPPPPRRDVPASRLQLVPVPPPRAEELGLAAAAGGDSSGTMPSRWPKEEVHALIQMRMEKEEQYHDMGPKAPLWEEIAGGMQRIGYNRSAKRCKEKWENINKYFKKVKESNKRRPEDSKTCPYFHQLDAIYRKKQFSGIASGSGSGVVAASGSGVLVVTASEQDSLTQRELEGKTSNDNIGAEETATGTPMLDDSAKDKEAEVTVAEADVQPQQQEFTGDETDSDEDMRGNYTDEGEDGDGDDNKMQYKIEYQKPNASDLSSAPEAETTAPATSSTPTSTTSFLAVQ